MPTYKIKRNERLNEFFPIDTPTRQELNQEVEKGNVDHNYAQKTATVFVGEKMFIFFCTYYENIIWLDYDTYAS